MSEHMPDGFDRTLGSLEGLPDCAQCKAATIRLTTPLLGKAQTFIIQTIRQRDVGDWVFLEYVDYEGSKRLVIPPKVSDVIARQRDALTGKNRAKGAQQAVETRKAKGIVPFQKKKHRKPAKSDE